MRSPELWLVDAPATPLATSGSGSLLHAESDSLGWAVIREPIPASVGSNGLTVSESHTEHVNSSVGGLLYAMTYRLERAGAYLPMGLLSRTYDSSAGVVGGRGTSVLLVVNGELRLATGWRFEDYHAAVTILDTSWVGVLAPRTTDLRLEATTDYREGSM